MPRPNNNHQPSPQQLAAMMGVQAAQAPQRQAPPIMEDFNESDFHCLNGQVLIRCQRGNPWGEVLSVGPGEPTIFGRMVKTSVAKGDVVFMTISGEHMPFRTISKITGEETLYVLCRGSQLVAKRMERL